jgi:hypothetical protein
VDDAPGMKCEEPDQPSNYEDDRDDIKYISHKIIFIII